jgi:periplasmic glucans biosynthesis protein
VGRTEAVGRASVLATAHDLLLERMFLPRVLELGTQVRRGPTVSLSKRVVLFAGLLLAAAFGAAAQPQTDSGLLFTSSYVDRLAADMAQKPYAAPDGNLPEQWSTLNYDQYRDIRFRRERAVWHSQNRNFEVHFLPSGWLFKEPVAINIVEGGKAHPVEPDNALFDFGSLAGPLPEGKTMPLSGFRVNGPINRPGVFDEIAVFQGASYFRAVSRGQLYGLSARGVAVDTGQPSGEEFPFFRTFWIETPARAARELVIHALLDSPSMTGAYTFRIAGGAPTAIDVDVRLYLRRDGTHVGVAPLTSMFLFSDVDRQRINDFREAVHDSEGLVIANAAGERIWRPLGNPRRLQISHFAVKDVTGFGLSQRHRKFANYQDLEAAYERRPSAWVVPRGWWGDGSVHLVEIPSEEEIHDNIVAYWRPQEPYRKAESYSFGYRLLWPDDIPRPAGKAIVVNTRSGLAAGPERKKGAIRYAVDFAGPALAGMKQLPEAALSATAGKIEVPVVERNPHTQGVRVNFLLRPENADLIELRLELKSEAKTISEVWLSRWTR